jgi:hypothetical protein
VFRQTMCIDFRMLTIQFSRVMSGITTCRCLLIRRIASRSDAHARAEVRKQLRFCGPSGWDQSAARATRQLTVSTPAARSLAWVVESSWVPGGSSSRLGLGV